MSVLSQIGYSGVRASQIALTATGQNIANVNTPGFSRLAPEMHSVGGQTASSIGGGVQVSSIRRLSNDFQNQQLWRASTDKNYYGTSQQYLTALEGLIHSEGSSVSVGLDNFFAALSEASSTPESIALRQQIIGEAKQLAQRFNGLNGNIGTQLNALQGQRVAMVAEINGLSGNIAELNAEILKMESAGRDTATLRDYRENLIKDLSQYAGIRVQEVADGTLTVSLANGQPLVAGTTAGQLRVEQNLAGEQELTLVFAKTTFPLVQEGLGGSLGALYDMEYGALRPAQADLHDMAAALAQMVNDTLAGGFDLNGNPGQPLFVEHLQQAVQLARAAAAYGPCRLALEQAKIAADLAQLEQRLEDDHLAARQALALDLVTHLAIHCQTQRFVELALGIVEFDPVDELVLRR